MLLKGFLTNSSIKVFMKIDEVNKDKQLNKQLNISK